MLLSDVVKLSSTSSLLEVHLVLFHHLLSVSLSLPPCSPTHPFVLNYIVSADSWFVLSNSFKKKLYHFIVLSLGINKLAEDQRPTL